MGNGDELQKNDMEIAADGNKLSVRFVSGMVEATGVEPVSENVSVETSPSAVASFPFPFLRVKRHTHRISSFMKSWRRQSLWRSRLPLKASPRRSVVLPGSASAREWAEVNCLIKQRQQRNYRCSLIYKCPLVSG